MPARRLSENALIAHIFGKLKKIILGDTRGLQ